MTTVSTTIKAIAAKLRAFLISLFCARNSAVPEDIDIELQAIQGAEDVDGDEAEDEDDEEAPAETPPPPSYSPSPPPYTPPQPPQIPIEDRTPSSLQPSLASHASALTLSPSQDLPQGEMRVRGPRK